MKTMFSIAVLKGLIEHRDGTVYFGSLMAYQYHKTCAVDEGWITDSGEVTNLGRKAYDDYDLGKLPRVPHSRAYAWNWKVSKVPKEDIR